MVELTLKPTKANNGTIASAIFELVGGEFGSSKEKKGRKIFHTFLVDHANPKAVEYSNNKLNKLLNAVGSDSSIEDLGHDFGQVTELALDIPIQIGVDLNEYEKDGEIVTGNKITSFKRK